MAFRLRTWGGGWGWLGHDVVVSDDTFWRLCAQKRVRFGLGETVRRQLHNRDVDQFESISYLGADAASQSFDQEA